MSDQILKFPLVTIAIPTFERPHLLERALESVASQDYNNLEVLIANNDPGKDSVKDVLEKFKHRISNITYFQHKKNIGGIDNFFFLLEQAHGDYFMWLADDDEILGSKYVSELVLILRDNPKAVTSFANWKLMNAPNFGLFKKSRDYRNGFWLLRAIKFIWYAQDDFFYGLHRIGNLRNAEKMNFWRQNKEIINWAYPYLLDMIIQGQVVQSRCDDIAWVNHDYTEKKYMIGDVQPKKNVLFGLFFRRLNVHYLYLIKIIKNNNVLYLPLIVFVSALSLFKEFSLLFYAKIQRSLR